MSYIKNLSIKQKLLLAVGGSVAVLLVVSALFTVRHLSQLTRQQVQAEVDSLVTTESVNIGKFFAEYAQVARTFLEAPQFQAWFQAYPCLLYTSDAADE